MIPIKIQCGCGQRYAFEAEPVAGRLGSPVACPVCGADGTEAANEIIVQDLAVTQPPGPPPSGLHLSLAHGETPIAPPRSANALPAIAPHASQLGLVQREQAEVEARAKVSWGDPPEAILKYLMIQGFTHPEASAFIKVLFQERAVQVRGVGMKKILTGILMLVAGSGGIIYMLIIHFIITKLAGALFALMVWGGWRLINGIIMVALPRLQSGDVAEQ